MAPRISSLCLLGANVLIPIAILTFASGFFPYKPFLSGLAQYEALEDGAPPNAPFDKLVFMVVDALRSDFVYSNNSGFSYTQSLISNGAALPFTAHATSPTITMPRIKAITTGSIPSFLDVILNFAESDTTSTLATQDTWLAQMKAKGAGKMLMYGDDTWLKLFPDFFDRADGTSSFFVSDFTEVDNNVTRHVPEELKNDDWNTMVLHYLGLDHIGHKSGPRSPNMVPKQREMDGIVRQIYEAIETKDYLSSTLLVLCGDHGMNDAGNHGGSAPGETSPALVFISPKLKTIGSGLATPAPYHEEFRYYNFVQQSDIAPTLGALLGFPVPKNNLGAFIPHFLPFWPSNSDKVRILERNAGQILKVVSAAFPTFEDAGPSTDCENLSSDVSNLACRWRSMKNISNADDQNITEWMKVMTKWLKEAQELMSGTASNYDVKKLVLGQVFAAVSLCLGIAAAFPTIAISIKSCSPILTVSLLYGIMMFASSYVEEEQHFWYWSTTAWLSLLCIKNARKENLQSSYFALSSIIIPAVTRIARRWNQTGQKYAGEPDIARTFFFEHRLVLWSLVGATYLWNLQSLASKAFPKISQLARGAAATALATVALTFKLAFTNEDSPELMAGLAKSIVDNDVGFSLVTRARVVFITLGISLIYTLFSGLGRRRPNETLRTLHDLLTLLLITQSRATNIPLFLLFEVQLSLLTSQSLTQIEISTTSLLLQYSSFFAFGGSNAISSIDLSSAYNGVSGYNVVAVGILTFVSNWAGPVFWTSATVMLLLRPDHAKLRSKDLSPNVVGGSKQEAKNDGMSLHTHLALLTIFTTSSLFFVMAACTLLRTHLFIWTVFSPKYLYSMAWSLGQHLGINLGFGSLLFWLGKRAQ